MVWWVQFDFEVFYFGLGLFLIIDFDRDNVVIFVVFFLDLVVKVLFDDVGQCGDMCCVVVQIWNVGKVFVVCFDKVIVDFFVDFFEGFDVIG